MDRGKAIEMIQRAKAKKQDMKKELKTDIGSVKSGFMTLENESSSGDEYEEVTADPYEKMLLDNNFSSETESDSEALVISTKKVVRPKIDVVAQPVKPVEVKKEIVGEKRKLDKEDQVVFQIYVGGLDSSVDREDLKKEFGKYGKVSRVKLLHRPGHVGHVGSGWIEYLTAEEARKAEASNGVVLKGNPIIVKGYDHSGEKAHVMGELSVFCVAVPKHASESVLSEFLADAIGSVNRVSIPLDGNKKSKGFAFVDFNDLESVEKALRLGHPKNKEGLVLEGMKVIILKGDPEKKKIAKLLPQPKVMKVKPKKTKTDSDQTHSVKDRNSESKSTRGGRGSNRGRSSDSILNLPF